MEFVTGEGSVAFSLCSSALESVADSSSDSSSDSDFLVSLAAAAGIGFSSSSVTTGCVLMVGSLFNTLRNDLSVVEGTVTAPAAVVVVVFGVAEDIADV